jgi:hypothetical protein
MGEATLTHPSAMAGKNKFSVDSFLSLPYMYHLEPVMHTRMFTLLASPLCILHAWSTTFCLVLLEWFVYLKWQEFLLFFLAGYWIALFGKEEGVCLSIFYNCSQICIRRTIEFVRKCLNGCNENFFFFLPDIHDLFQEKPGYFELAQQLTVSCISK